MCGGDYGITAICCGDTATAHLRATLSDRNSKVGAKMDFYIHRKILYGKLPAKSKLIHAFLHTLTRSGQNTAKISDAMPFASIRSKRTFLKYMNILIDKGLLTATTKGDKIFFTAYAPKDEK